METVLDGGSIKRPKGKTVEEGSDVYSTGDSRVSQNSAGRSDSVLKFVSRRSTDVEYSDTMRDWHIEKEWMILINISINAISFPTNTLLEPPFLFPENISQCHM
jgi:hypothetical protein